ncbi:hypothetical protein, partial [Stenotrophomonas maltophilia]
GMPRAHGANGPACVTRPPPDSFLRARNESEIQNQKKKARSKAAPTKVGSYPKHIACNKAHRARSNVSRG